MSVLVSRAIMVATDKYMDRGTEKEELLWNDQYKDYRVVLATLYGHNFTNLINPN